MKKSDEDKIKNAMMHPNKLGAGAKKRKKLSPRRDEIAVMEEFARGTLHSGDGKIVKDYRQAYAIAKSESKRNKNAKS
jgi:hypothetical protein